MPTFRITLDDPKAKTVVQIDKDFKQQDNISAREQAANYALSLSTDGYYTVQQLTEEELAKII